MTMRMTGMIRLWALRKSSARTPRIMAMARAQRMARKRETPRMM